MLNEVLVFEILKSSKTTSKTLKLILMEILFDNEFDNVKIIKLIITKIFSANH